MTDTTAPSTPKIPQTINTEPSARQFGVLPGDSSSPKDLTYYLQNAASQITTAGTPISAIFLVQFDVRSGYELKWYKKADDSVSLKGVEFKSLPSGLHEVEREVISFVQPKDQNYNVDAFEDLLYGVSVYRQNLSEALGQSRDHVKMFSLGILVDPFLQNSKLSSLSRFASSVTWKPIDYTKGLEYVDKLSSLLKDWDSDSDDYTDFETFFDDHSTASLVDQLLLKSPRTPKSLPKLSIETSTPASKHHSYHYLLKLPSLLEHLGPLVFRLWRSTLLREKVILFDAPSVQLNCAFSYCLSILSSIPQDLVPVLSESSSRINTTLRYVQPLYSVGVNDIDWLRSLKASDSDDEFNYSNHSFVASSTDEILLFKTALYDVAVQFNSLEHSASKVPKLLLSKASVPGTHIDPLKATQRDLKRFKIISEIFGLYDNHPELKTLDTSEEFKWWYENAEPTSWKQLAWSGFYWWATAGEKSRVEEEPEFENLKEIDEVKGETEKALFIVGYFQSMIRRIFNTILDIMKNEESSVKRDGEDESLVITPLVIDHSDLFEMGLDPGSNEDREFVIKLTKTWWNRDAKIGSTFGDLCCF